MGFRPGFLTETDDLHLDRVIATSAATSEPAVARTV